MTTPPTLPALLATWDIDEDTVETFAENGIEVSHFKDLSDELLKELCPKISTRILIRNKINEYLLAESKTSTVTSMPSCSQDSPGPSATQDIFAEGLDSNFDETAILEMLSVRPPFPEFDLRTLLSKSPTGNSILAYYKAHNTLTSKHRNTLADIISRRIFTRLVNHRINHEEYNILTSKIIALFPAENAGTYFVPPIKKRDSISGKPVLARGKLVDKIRNTLFKSGERKRKLPEKENIPMNAKRSKNLQELEDKHKIDVVWLKNNTEPWEDVIKKWKATYELRQLTEYDSVSQFIENWPILNDVRSDVLINSDFDAIHPEKSHKFFLLWTDFFEKIKEIKIHQKSKDDTAELVEYIDGIADEEHKLPSQIELLCKLVPPKGRLSRREKFSISECIESFLVNVKEEILEIERKSSLLTSAIDQTIKSIEEYKEEVGIKQNGQKPEKTMAFEAEIHVENCPYPNVINGGENTNGGNVLEGYRPVQFNPEELQNARRELKSAMVSNGQVLQNQKVRQPYRAASGEIIGTHQGIVDGLDKAIVEDTIEELGKPGMTEEKIAELISGESEMLREAHVMGLCRVLSTKMHRPGDDSSVDFKKIKPVIESLNHSEVLKALNEELMRTKEEKKKEERKWTTFMQKPQRPVPRVKFGYHGYSEQESREQEPYKPKIVKQPKPKIAPDYRPEEFETGLLPWEERALREPTPPPVAPEDPILIPEEEPEILEAVDPLPESEVPDLEDSGIPLPISENEEDTEEEEGTVEIEEIDIEAVVEETEKILEDNIETLVEEMETGNVAEQLMANVQNMVDPNAPLEQQLSQMRAQLATLAQLPGVIQQSLDMVTRQLSQLTTLESQIKSTTAENASEVTKDESEETQQGEAAEQPGDQQDEGVVITEEIQAPVPEVKQPTAEDLERMRIEEEAMLEEQRRIEKQKKELMEQARLEHESRQIKQRAAPRVGKPSVGKPTPAFGPACPVERPVVLPGGRKWRKPQDAYNEAFIAETLAAQAEIIRGKAKGLSYESVLLPYDERINFMKYEKPPVTLDHLQESETYKLIHNMESQPLKRVETLTPQICEADYRQKCRSITPCTDRMAKEEHLDYPQQVQP